MNILQAIHFIIRHYSQLMATLGSFSQSPASITFSLPLTRSRQHTHRSSTRQALAFWKIPHDPEKNIVNDVLDDDDIMQVVINMYKGLQRRKWNWRREGYRWKLSCGELEHSCSSKRAQVSTSSCGEVWSVNQGKESESNASEYYT